VTRPRKPIRTGLLLLLCTLAAGAQTTPTAIDTPTPKAPKPPTTPKARKSDTPSFNTSLIVLDPAHGGADKGATLGENSFEKDATIAFAGRLRSLLTSKGFTVVYTHSSASDDASADSRVEATNRNHPVACILLHASAAGHGVHLLTSSLTPPRATQSTDDPKAIAPWDTAQAPLIPQSLRLADDLSAAINGARIPLVVGRTSVRPIDSMTCPAVALELSPLAASGDSSTPATDEGYQNRVAQTVTNALVTWREQVISATAAAQAAKAVSPQTPGTPTAVKPVPSKPKPKLVTPPVEVPAETSPTPAPRRTPAPVIRKNPDATPSPNAGPPQ
jgi:N-acetylmuramoyl-L-alanine amidase